jgi:hypothetical protein
MYYYPPQSPFILPLFGMFIAFTCGITFQTIFEQRLLQWSKRQSIDRDYILEGTDLKITYWTACLGVWFFLAGGLMVFGFGVITSFGFCLPLAIFTGGFIWKQLRELLLEVKNKGVKTLDLDDPSQL